MAFIVLGNQSSFDGSTLFNFRIKALRIPTLLTFEVFECARDHCSKFQNWTQTSLAELSIFIL